MIKPQTRRRARSLVIQAIYQWQLADDDVPNIKKQFREKLNPKKTDVAYFDKLFDGTTKNVKAIDDVIKPLLDRVIEDLDAVELAVLRVATYELMKSLDVPYKVIINEALELTKKFGSIEGYKYVNGVLDKVARLLRETKK